MTRRVPDRSRGSALRGLWFVFEQEGHTFALWTSSITGKEEVYVDGQLVATKTKIALTSVHTVGVGGKEYTIALSTPHLTKGVFQVTLARSGRVLQGWATRFVTRRSTPVSIITVLASAILIFALPGSLRRRGTLSSAFSVSGRSRSLGQLRAATMATSSSHYRLRHET